jgi:geranylgeranyl diphosphate synthase type II
MTQSIPTQSPTFELDPAFAVETYLADCRRLALDEIQRFIASDTRRAGGLYDVMLEYPLRPAKALRPALCIATTLAMGGYADAVLPSAAVFELFHNASRDRAP